MLAVYLAAILACAHAQHYQQQNQQQYQQQHQQQYQQQELMGDYDEQQQVQQFAQQSIKNGQGNWEHFGQAADLVKTYGNNPPHGIPPYNMRQNLTGPGPNLDVGVCYIEVPTASLVRGGQIPVGNGSQPHLSRIRSCCKGYIRNIHNFRKCDPVCTKECVNALCTAPETCTCFPDHVKNLAGFCIPTCPIGCQNGHCSGGECLCKEGFRLDSESKYCQPFCRENCGGIGNCTAPNTCECRPGYHSTPEGSCKPTCDRCTNGDCVAPNECRCHHGYVKDQHGQCSPQCNPGCGPTSRCVSPNVCDPPIRCDKPCLNAECVGVNVCACNAGYEHDPADRHRCVPHCPGGCANGICSVPNVCLCNMGYAKDQQGQCAPRCTPACEPPSRCVSPNVCNIVQPSQPNNNLYPDLSVLPVPNEVPQCAEPCLNGICIGNNKCACNDGYEPDPVDNHRCLPHCPGGCPNGICSAPNFCICNMGYVKDRSVKGRPTCVKRQKRSVDANEAVDEKPKNIADFLVFEIPDY